MATKTVEAFPSSWLDRLQGWPMRLTVDVAGFAVTAEVSREQLTRVYLPVLNLLQNALGDRRRIVAALAGEPGSGKSTFVAILSRLADVLLGMSRLVAVGMDGWHWPNAILDARTTTDEAGRAIPLRQRKGSPESFDVASMVAAIRQLQSADSVVALPVYDRRLHEPVPSGLIVGPGTTIVLIEGNYLLDRSSPWSEVSTLLHPKLYLDAEPKIARDRVLARHIRGGISPEEAQHKYAINDRLNAQMVHATKAHAQYIIQLEPQPMVVEQ